ncbi:MAG: DNA circularization N-terminal domain-containing protein [Reinekea sp.]
MTNKTATHQFPGLAGGKSQDLGMGPRQFELTLFFNDEQNSDLDSTAFMEAYYQDTGDWSVIHPTKGQITLIKISASELVDPVNSGGLFAVTTSWVEQIRDTFELTSVQLQAIAENQSGNLNSSAQSQFVNNAKQDEPGQKQGIITCIGKALTKIKTQLALVKGSLTLDPKIISIGLSITNTLNGGVDNLIDTEVLASQMQQLIQAYGLGQTSSTTAIQMFSDFSSSILDDAPTTPVTENLSAIAVTELVATAALTASGQMALIGGITSRDQTITAVQLLLDQFAEMTQRLDEIQTLFNGQPIDLAYFSQSDSYGDSLLMVSQATRFLLRTLYGLPTQRTIIVKEPTATIQFAKDQYGQINTTDNQIGNYQTLVDSNELCCDELWILPQGKEVLIYQ